MSDNKTPKPRKIKPYSLSYGLEPTISKSERWTSGGDTLLDSF